MLKSKELSDPNSCLNRAKDDEPIFVLLGRDLAAFSTIQQWVTSRIVLNKNKIDDPQIQEALALAAEMTIYHVGNSKTENK